VDAYGSEEKAMRRTHATLMNDLHDNPKLVADQLGHTLDVNQNVYTRVSLLKRKQAVDPLEAALPSFIEEVRSLR
jgi:integrase